MQIQIHNYLSCCHLLESQPDKWDSIVILDSSLGQSDFVLLKSKASLQLKFDDVTAPSANKSQPTPEAIELALNFGMRSEKLVVCCRAGQSRSAAIAFALVFESAGEQSALALLNPKRHAPNSLILQIADSLIDRLGLLNAFDKWNESNNAVRLTDHLDALELEYEKLESLGAKDRISNPVRKA